MLTSMLTSMNRVLMDLKNFQPRTNVSKQFFREKNHFKTFFAQQLHKLNGSAPIEPGGDSNIEPTSLLIRR